MKLFQITSKTGLQTYVAAPDIQALIKAYPSAFKASTIGDVVVVNPEGVKTYTSDETEGFVRIAVAETTDSMREYFEKETKIVDMTTRKEIINCEIAPVNEDNHINDYMFARLKKRGIDFTNKELQLNLSQTEEK